jgi:acyl-CoA thioesterase-2
MTASMSVLDALVDLLSLERIEDNIYRGQSQDPGWGTVYGGQVLGQALRAALYTVPPERTVHSLHAYFLRPGDVKVPIVYDVDRSRDGTSFTTRRVKAIQHGHPILNLAASFHKAEPGLTHAEPMPQVPPPEALPTDQERLVPHAAKLPPFLREQMFAERAIEVRTVDESDVLLPGPAPGRRAVWMRATHRLSDDVGLHAALLAYASDYAFLTTALKPHGVTWITPGMQVASIDHAVWFHDTFRADEWLLHVMHSPWSGGARGLVMGHVYTRDGRLVASTSQEGLMRQRPVG